MRPRCSTTGCRVSSTRTSASAPRTSKFPSHASTSRASTTTTERRARLSTGPPVHRSTASLLTYLALWFPFPSCHLTKFSQRHQLVTQLQRFVHTNVTCYPISLCKSTALVLTYLEGFNICSFFLLLLLCNMLVYSLLASCCNLVCTKLRASQLR